jgi:hypothetical protein
LYYFGEIDWKVMETQEPEASDLRHSSEKVGRLCPILLDKDGNIIDGQHRLAVDADWPAIRLDHIGSEKERLLARLVSNVCRRTVSSSEKRGILGRLGRIYIEEGEKREKLPDRIAEETGMSYRWVMKYLPQHLKTRAGLGGPSTGLWKLDKCKEKYNISKVARCATLDHAMLLSTLQGRSVVVRTYTNASFVNLTLDKRIYEKFETLAGLLGVKAETLIGNVIILTLKELEKINPLLASVAVKKPVS